MGWCGQLLGFVGNSVTLAVGHHFFPPHFLPLTPKCSGDLIDIYVVFQSKHNFKNPYTQTNTCIEKILSVALFVVVVVFK